jgi:hypothetical protein
MRRRLILVGLLTGLAGFTAGLLAQGPVPEPRPGDILDGHDLGLRVEVVRGDKIVGTLVARVGDRWLEVEPVPPPPVLPAPSRH